MKWAIVVLVAASALAGLWFALTGSGGQTPILAKIPVRTILPNARPLVWLDEQYLLTGVDNKIVKLDTRDSRIVETVSEPYYPREGNECFSRDGGRFAVTEPEDDGQGGVSYMNMVYRWIEDWDQPLHFEDRKTLKWWSSNPFDCTELVYEEAARDEQSAPPLLRQTDGRTKVYYRGGEMESPHKRIVTILKYGRTTEVTLETTPRWLPNQIDVRSSFDESSGRYFWHLQTEDFNVADHDWPLKGWWVTPEGKVIDQVPLPSGPWVRAFSTVYTLRYFSCGPSCYTNMKIWVGNGRIYIVVWGDAVDTAVEGVYRLDTTRHEWEKIIAGALDNGLILSPSGCQIAYAQDGRLNDLTLCDKNNVGSWAGL